MIHTKRLPDAIDTSDKSTDEERHQSKVARTRSSPRDASSSPTPEHDVISISSSSDNEDPVTAARIQSINNGALHALLSSPINAPLCRGGSKEEPCFGDIVKRPTFWSVYCSEHLAYYCSVHGHHFTGRGRAPNCAVCNHSFIRNYPLPERCSGCSKTRIMVLLREKRKDGTRDSYCAECMRTGIQNFDDWFGPM